MSNEFLAAAASWFGMDPDRLADATMSTNAQGLTLVFKVKLDADDYLGIADRMRVLREPLVAQDEELEDRSQFAAMPTLQQVMRTPIEFMDRPECAELIGKAMSMSKGVRLMVEDELARRAAGNQQDPEGEKPGALPPHVYLDQHELTGDQRLWILGVDHQGKVAMPLDQLTAEQQAKYGPKPAADGEVQS